MRVPYALAVHGEEEERAIVDVLRKNQTIMGKRVAEFEAQCAHLFGTKRAVMVNSGSSANLLCCELLRLPESAEVVTPALTFSTTISPIFQCRAKPKLVDVNRETFVVDVDTVREAISSKTRALIIPNLIGNLPDLKGLHDLASDFGIPYVQDSCDTIGARFDGKPIGTFSDCVTSSFYGSHIITCAGGGGIVCTDNDSWADRVRILRGWGRSSALSETEDIEARYATRVDGHPYDSKYVFVEMGYNFLPLELEAAFGLEQLKKLERFASVRRENFKTLYRFLQGFSDFFILPTENDRSETNWLAFPVTLAPSAPFSRLEFVRHLEVDGIQTRPVFTGNIARHPGFRAAFPPDYPDSFPNSDYVMQHSFLVGINQGLSRAHLNHLTESIRTFVADHSSRAG